LAERRTPPVFTSAFCFLPSDFRATTADSHPA